METVNKKSKPNVMHGLPEKVIFCKRCVMSNQRPSSSPELRKNSSDIETVHFNNDGVCHACLYSDLKEEIDWKDREEELLRLLDEHRRNDGRHDVVVPGCGGKDSIYVSHFSFERGKKEGIYTWYLDEHDENLKSREKNIRSIKEEGTYENDVREGSFSWEFEFGKFKGDRLEGTYLYE